MTRTYDDIKAEALSIPKHYELILTEPEARLVAREISLAWTFQGRRIRVTGYDHDPDRPHHPDHDRVPASAAS